MPKSHYETLGVTENASLKEIKQAYRTLIKQHHPDKVNQANRTANEIEAAITEAEAFTKTITGAYEILSDPELRHQYDQKRRSGQERKEEKFSNNEGVDRGLDSELISAINNWSSSDVIKKLIEKKVDLNAKDWEGNTALTKAISQNRWHIIEMLIEAKVDIHVKNSYGKNMVNLFNDPSWHSIKLREMAIKHGHDELAGWLSLYISINELTEYSGHVKGGGAWRVRDYADRLRKEADVLFTSPSNQIDQAKKKFKSTLKAALTDMSLYRDSKITTILKNIVFILGTGGLGLFAFAGWAIHARTTKGKVKSEDVFFGTKTRRERKTEGIEEIFDKLPGASNKKNPSS